MTIVTGAGSRLELGPSKISIELLFTETIDGVHFYLSNENLP